MHVKTSTVYVYSNWYGERAFSVAGPTAWNSLPDDIRQTTDTAAFKRQLKTHYFNLAFIT